VLNLYYTGLGIARSLGERSIPVVGVTAERGVYGNFSRFGRTVRYADSRKDPETLLTQLLELASSLGHRAILYPTRDHDLVFIDRFRQALDPHYSLVISSSEALERCLNKWQTFAAARAAGVPTPKAWIVESGDDVRRVGAEVRFPCVLKPLAAHHWRADGNWHLVGARKAIGVSSLQELLLEYATIERADRRALVQELVPGDDDHLVVAACYVDRNSTFRAGFTAQKLVQDPPGFGTGCIIQTADRPELFERTIRLLQTMQFTGIAEVEYKWDSTAQEYQLIEVNPRPWDQHRLGRACGVDLAYLAYCDHAGLSLPDMPARFRPQKWIAEDALLLSALRLIWRRQPGLWALLRQARGRRQYAIWSWRDPLPFCAYAARLIPSLMLSVPRSMRQPASRRSDPTEPAVRVTP
jgi:predicted ATP-grasp superfamily ATP-dependent carboligase